MEIANLHLLLVFAKKACFFLYSSTGLVLDAMKALGISMLGTATPFHQGIALRIQIPCLASQYSAWSPSPQTGNPKYRASLEKLSAEENLPRCTNMY